MEWQSQLQTIPSGATLFDIYALDIPTELGGTETLIGSLELTSNLYASAFGDAVIQFRHQNLDHDLELHPEWDPYVFDFYREQNPTLTVAERKELQASNAAKRSSGCPFLK